MTNETIRAALDRLDAGDWDAAHRLVQDDPSADAAWIHAHLHRVEGDAENAAYWYVRAGKPAERCDLDAERRALRSALG